jgi:gamma-glutamyltranspeptidase/glutathione hydrolase
MCVIIQSLLNPSTQGDAFCIFYDATTKKLTTMNGSGRSPKALSLQKARELGLTGAEIPLLNINAVTVPGCAAAWVDTLTKFGSGNVSLKDVLAPAIRLAEEG